MNQASASPEKAIEKLLMQSGMGVEVTDMAKTVAVIGAIAASSTKSTIDVLLKMLLGQRSGNESKVIVDSLNAAGIKIDSESTQHLQAIASGIAINLLSGSNDIASVAALAFNTTGCGGARSLGDSVDLSQLSESAIHRLGGEARRRPAFEKQIAIPVLTFAKVKPLLDPGVTPDTVDAAVKTVSTEIGAGLKKLTQEVSAALTAAQKTILIQDEELQHLWWLIGGRSEDCNTEFRNVDAQTKTLIFAKELAFATQILPGPTSLRALLFRAGIDEQPISIPDAVNACSIDWLKSLGDLGTLSHPALPIHMAISRRLETGETSQWIVGWRGATGFKDDFKIPALEVGVQFFRERLLHRTF